jgi:hypothetical protein
MLLVIASTVTQSENPKPRRSTRKGKIIVLYILIFPFLENILSPCGDLGIRIVPP